MSSFNYHHTGVLMNKIIFSLITAFSFALIHGTDATQINPRDMLITAIAHNDYGSVLKALEALPSMTQTDKDEFLQIADQLILTTIIWHTKHHDHGEIGKDTVKAFGYYLATVLCGGATAIAGGIIASTVEAHYKPDHHSRLEVLPPLMLSTAAATILAGVTTYLGYKTVQKIIDSWMKPSQRLENALRIKDAILHHAAVSTDLAVNS